MLYLVIKAALSGIIIAAISEIARRSPTAGALVASLPLVSTLAMIWLWHDTHDTKLVAAQVGGTFWFFLPSIPMFLVIPWLLRQGVGFWLTLGLGSALTIVLYLAMIWIGGRFGLIL